MVKISPSEKYPTLYHYTNWEALKNILATNEIWATNIRKMNDESEYVLARNYIEHNLMASFSERVEQMAANNKARSDKLREFGGKVSLARSLAKTSIDGLYEATGDDIFVASFCGEPADDYVKKNGLLSQWRAYGGQQGFLLILKSAGMEKLANEEVRRFSFGPTHLSDVIYDVDRSSVDREFAGSMKLLCDYTIGMYEQIASGEVLSDGSGAQRSFLDITTRYKHRAFVEEREVRLVVSLFHHTEEYLNLLQQRGKMQKTEKPVDLRMGRLGLAPFVKLFGKESGPLPVERIVVGPHKDKASTADALLKHLRGRNITVDVSDIPFV
jgi:hypothetical protein